MTGHGHDGRSGTDRRSFIRAAGLSGLAGIIASGRAPAFAQGAGKKLVFAHINAEPESAAVAFKWMADECGKRSNGALTIEFIPRRS